ncbi:hypothetical protein PT015_22165 [Candidatus Mycobacterium wuenschmannii]|uniref:Uncharacterized protein n=1 Tax=Candidatus Mycobacterium wuenschmannii TaxID=3027808 RepID=A0ABY8VV35_9MYCO|nr:hypothetical protein [Candidatus Mycobacterium wuenschmannii]WIM87510.1 hypothetical protein PT015_22165 [Candidatus Mycobacterium wuenschmannii]
MRKLRGIELRYVLTMHLARHGRSTIGELVGALAHHGFSVDTPANKSVSDALRWECRRGRVRRVGWGMYSPGEMPRGTEYRIRQRELALRAAANSLEGGQLGTSPGAVTAETRRFG